MKITVSILFLSVMLIMCCCDHPKKKIVVTNALDLDRENETVSLLWKDLTSVFTIEELKNILVKELETGKIITTQWIDNDQDSIFDELIFQTTLKANENKKFVIETTKNSNPVPPSLLHTYSRFVPERTDDFAWENDRVACRTYGPEAQRLVEEKQPGGTLSSGMDCWLKRVDHPIINSWYKKNAEGGSYHKDTGEGLDNYHVGASRGCGGIGVWQDDSLFVSKNFITHKILSNGPIRTVFELTYAPWNVNGITIQEKKRISIDLGSQLSRYEVMLQPSTSLPNITVGITLHDKKGVVKVDTAAGWFSYWEPLDDSELGTGVVIDPMYFQAWQDYRTDKKDLSQLYVMTTPQNNTVVYYAGFGWKKAGRFNTAEDWTNYLRDYTRKLHSPLKITITP